MYIQTIIIVQSAIICFPYRRMGDGIGEAFATGNLGNTLQMMGKYDEAIMCFTHELAIARQLNDKVNLLTGNSNDITKIATSFDFSVFIKDV